MSDIKVCRICLNTGVKLYSYSQFNLKQYYEEVIAAKLDVKDSLPNHFCYECAAILHKFHKFKEKCCSGQNVLLKLLWKGPITIKSIENIDRHGANLESSIDVLKISRRIRTCLTKSKTITQMNREGEPVIKPPKVEEVIKCNSDNSSDDEILAEYKKGIIDKEKINVDKEKISVDTENITIEKEKISNEVEKISIEASDDGNMNIDTHLISDDNKSEFENTPLNERENETKEIIFKQSENDKKKNQVGNKKNNEEKDKLKKFEKRRNIYLDLQHWLTVNLTDEEALREFQAKAEDRKYLSAAYKCTDCYKGFSKEDMLVRHRKLRHSESLGPFVCRFCVTRYKWNHQLTRHITEHYLKYKCLRCDLVCPLKTSAIFHNDYHNGVIRKCEHCGDEFKHLSTYYTHLRTHRSEHVCTLCGASFVSAAGLNQHKRIIHIGQNTEGANDEIEYCARCDIKFESRQAFQEHLLHSTKHVDGLDDLELSTPSKPRKPGPRLKVRKIPTDCYICGKHFGSQVEFKKHHQAEHPGTPVTDPTERYICEICGISLKSRGNIAGHLNTHTRAKLFGCNTCGKQFSSKLGLTKHLLSHSSEKRVPCPLCEKRFKETTSMKLHYRTFHLKEPYPKRKRNKKLNDSVHDASDGSADCFNSKYFDC